MAPVHLPFASMLPGAVPRTDADVVLDTRSAQAEPSGIGTYVEAIATRLPALLPTRRFVYWVAEGSALAGFTAPNLDRVLLAARSGNAWQRIHARTNSPGCLWWPELIGPLPQDGIFHGPQNHLPLRPAMRAVVTVHDLMWLQHPAWMAPSLLQRVPKYLYNRSGLLGGLRRAQRVITVSRAVADALRAHDPSVGPRLVVIPNAVGSEFYAPTDRDAARAKAAALLGDAREYVLVVGLNLPTKGHDLALQAFSAGCSKDHLLVLVQRRDPGRGLERLARELGIAARVRFLPSRSLHDLRALYQGALCLLHPSRAEGFGLPVLEAMACGCPVVASDIAPLVEVAGGAARHAPTEDARALAVCLSGVVTDRSVRDELRGRGLERVRAFSWDRSAAAVAEVYASLLG